MTNIRSADKMFVKSPSDFPKFRNLPGKIERDKDKDRIWRLRSVPLVRPIRRRVAHEKINKKIG